MNEFVVELPDFIDLEYMKNLADTMLTEEWLYSSDPVALRDFTDVNVVDVTADEYLNSIRQQYPNLADKIKLMKCGQGSWPIHIDRHRLSAINIPVTNCDNTKTSKFYRNGTVVDSIVATFGSVTDIWYSNEYLSYVQDAELAYEHVLTVPTLTNTKTPHQIVNNTETTRVIFSWAYNENFEQAKQVFI